METGIRLLMVEDVAEEAALASQHLKRAGIEHHIHRVETESDLRNALDEFHPSLILSDFSLPQFDGMSALRISQEVSPEVPFIFFSGTIGEERAIEALKSGATDYVLKGNPRRLSSAVTRAMDEFAERSRRRRAEERVRRLSRVHAMLSNFNSAVLRIRDREELLREACRIAISHGQYPVAWAGVLDEERTTLTKVASAGLYPQLFGEGPFALDLGARGPENLLLRALRTRRRAVMDRAGNGAGNANGNPGGNGNGTNHVGPLQRDLGRLGLESAIALPLFVGEDPVGVLALAGASAQLFDDGEIKLLEELAGDLSYALQYLRQEARLRYLANYDSLTGLANRELLALRLQQLIDSASPGSNLGVGLFDVQHLGDINHALGRHLGDQLLQQMAARLRKLMPDAARLGHLGSGVFATVFTLSSEAESFKVQEWYERQLLQGPLKLEGQELRISGHLGVALYPGDGSDAGALLNSAEVALRNAKGAGERVMYSSPLLNARVARRLSLEGRLRNALEQERFSLQLQPKVDIASGAIAGFEALLRWFEPDTENVPPEIFVPVLEDMGLIDAVGEWLLYRASTLRADWQEEGRQVRIAVNVSARQLARRDFAQHLKSRLDPRSNGDPGIDLELTESSLLADIEASIVQLRQAREMGFGIAIDDFGTGYSSLNQLVRMPADTLKIDKSFVQRMTVDRNMMAVVATIASLADTMQMKTVAEGVETNEQLEKLRELGCHEYQGFLFSPPVSVAAAKDLLSAKARN